MLDRFMQADTLVPGHQGTQAVDRYAFVNNNPLKYTDPSGHYFKECGDDYYRRCGTISPPKTYNILICGIGDGNNCGSSNPQTPLTPYYCWPGKNVFFDVDHFGDKVSTAEAVLEFLTTLDPQSKLRLVGHSAGADAVILVTNFLALFCHRVTWKFILLMSLYQQLTLHTIPLRFPPIWLILFRLSLEVNGE